MRRGQKTSAEQVVLKPRQIEVQTAPGKSLAMACKEAEISEQSYYRWRKEYGGLQVENDERLSAERARGSLLLAFDAFYPRLAQDQTVTKSRLDDCQFAIGRYAGETAHTSAGLMFPRYAEGAIREALADTRVVAISGPRQAGKTTLARKIAGRERTFLTLDDAAVLASARRDPNGLVRSLDRAVIDEIQRAPELLLAIKQSVDEDPRPGRFLITGSADLQAIPRTQDSLAGRIEVVPLLPLAQAEILGRAHPPRFIDAVFGGEGLRPLDGEGSDRSGTDDAVAAVLAGGYPDAVARRSERRRADWYRAYVSAILTRDLTDLAALDKIHRVPNLVEVLAHHAGDLVNWANLGGKLGLDAATVQRYVTLLEHLFLVRRVRAYSGNDLKRVVSTSKLHFLDSGLLAGLLGLEAGRLRVDRQPLGPVLEAFVFGELTKLAGWSDVRPAIYHYRDKDQVEVDFVLEDARRGVVGIEVKAAATVRDSDFKGLRRLQGHLGDRFRFGVILYDGGRVLPFGDRMVAAPLSALWQ